MKLLEDRILNDGNVLGENILKVDSFLTHQVDFDLMREIGKVFAEKFKDAGITKVVTIEASGIAPALYAAEALDVPMIFAKKAKNAKKIVIPATIKKVNKKGFTGTKKLKTIVVKGTKSFTVKKGAFKSVNSKKITVKVNKKMSAKEFKKLKKNLKKAGFKGKIKK